MSKAEERALEVYPPKLVTYGDLFGEETLDDNSLKRIVFIEGYQQAEKDLKLTWKDIADILDITDVIANDDSMEERLKTMSEEEYCQEVLKRFNKERK